MLIGQGNNTATMPAQSTANWCAPVWGKRSMHRLSVKMKLRANTATMPVQSMANLCAPVWDIDANSVKKQMKM